jgi:hypothetical protein
MRILSQLALLCVCCAALAQRQQKNQPFARTELYDEQLLMQELQLDQQQIQAQIQVGTR